MTTNRIGIITDCIGDLPGRFIMRYDVGIVYFLIVTESGEFTDTEEITSDNMFSYLQSSTKKVISKPPTESAYADLYRKYLKKYDKLIHIATSSKVSASYSIAQSAINSLGEDGKRIVLVDSLQVSSGLGYLVMETVEMVENGCEIDDILPALADISQRLSSTFLLYNCDHLYANGRVSKRLVNLSRRFNVHPVVTLKNGEMSLKYLLFGNYDKAAAKYVNRELKKKKGINTKRLVITCSGCPSDKIELVKLDINKLCQYDELIVTKASATISTNCGPDSFGLLFVNKRKEDK